MTKKLRKEFVRCIIAAVLLIAFFVFRKTEAAFPLFSESMRYWILFGISAALYLFSGYDVLILAGKNIRKGHPFDENFLMVIATFGAFYIGEFTEAVGVMVFYQIGQWFEHYAVGKSRNSITDLLEMAPDFARVLQDGNEEKTDPEDVPVGSLILIKPGDKVPLDGIVIAGNSSLNTASLTGEAKPFDVSPGDSVISGSINLNGVLTVQTTKEYKDSTVNVILELIENATEEKAPTESFITKFAKYYTPAVTVCALLLALVPSLFNPEQASEWIRRACTFLVISCPCALVISVPLGFFGGIGAASRHGVLIKGSQYLEILSRADLILFDKTGTITKGEFGITGILTENGFSETEVLKIAGKLERKSTHPIALAILKECEMRKIETEADFSEFNEIPGVGIEAKEKEKESTYQIGNFRILKGENRNPEFKPSETATVIYVLEDEKPAGRILLEDIIKEDAIPVINALKRRFSFSAGLLSGDNERTAGKVSEIVGLDFYKAGLLPEDKVRELERIKKNNKKPVVYVGDGMNDAPVLLKSDIGISMGAMGSDSAIEASDIVIMDDRLSHLTELLSISGKTMRIVKENIVLALGVKFAALLLGAAGLAGIGLAMFADVGVAVLAILNSMRMLYDKVDKK